jgi:hypothetical protein
MIISLIIAFILLQRDRLDFTLKIYRQLLCALQKKGYRFLTFEQYCVALQTHDTILSDNRPIVILRHDVDLKAIHSLRTAQIEHELGIQASYYFRVVAQSNQPDIIRQIVDLGHEIGYHYEDMSLMQGNTEKAYAHFCEWLLYFRMYYPVRTVCMHGAPTSQWDSKDIWKSYSYKDLGLVGEPYFDVDFSQVFYLTDTGRRWDGYKVSVRDKIPLYQDQWTAKGLVYRSTRDVIRAAEKGTLPKAIMVTTHPQRWTNNVFTWMKEFIVQNIKNTIKRMLILLRS